MLRINFFFRKPGHSYIIHPAKRYKEYAPANNEQLMVKVDQLNSYIATLQRSLEEKENEVKKYQNILLRYESVLREEISICRLQKTKIETIEDAYHCYETLMKDIENQISTFIENMPPHSKTSSTKSPIKRILFRLFRQKDLNQTIADEKLCEIEDVIQHKMQLLERFQSELLTLKKGAPEIVAESNSQSLNLN